MAEEKRITKREKFLNMMNEIVPWEEWEATIRPYYPENRKIVQRNSQFALEEPESHKWYLFRSIFSVFSPSK